MMETRSLRQIAVCASMSAMIVLGCAVEDKDSEPDPELVDQAWDEMTPDERVLAQVGPIERRLERLEAGDVEDIDAEASELAGLISALRAELWGTDEGRAKYRELTERLEEVWG